jgi:hypothetical protein
MLNGLIHHKGFMVNEVVLGYVFLRVCRFFSVTVTPPKFHKHIHFNSDLIRNIRGRSHGIF